LKRQTHCEKEAEGKNHRKRGKELGGIRPTGKNKQHIATTGGGFEQTVGVHHGKKNRADDHSLLFEKKSHYNGKVRVGLLSREVKPIRRGKGRTRPQGGEKSFPSEGPFPPRRRARRLTREEKSSIHYRGGKGANRYPNLQEEEKGKRPSNKNAFEEKKKSKPHSVFAGSESGKGLMLSPEKEKKGPVNASSRGEGAIFCRSEQTCTGKKKEKVLLEPRRKPRESRTSRIESEKKAAPGRGGGLPEKGKSYLDGRQKR